MHRCQWLNVNSGIKDAVIKMQDGLIKRKAKNKCASTTATDVFIRPYLSDEKGHLSQVFIKGPAGVV